MWFAIISSIIFLAITTILFTPELRRFSMYRSLSFFFLFEGIYSLINFIVTEIWINFSLMPTIHDIGCIILGSYVLITAYSYKSQNRELSVDLTNNIGSPEYPIQDNPCDLNKDITATEQNLKNTDN